MNSPTPLGTLTHLQKLGKNLRLLYTEAGAKALTELAKPAHRLSLARGFWAPGKNQRQELGMRLVELSVIYSRNESREGESLAAIFLLICSIAEQRGIDLGKSVLASHYLEAAKEK